MQYLNSAHSKTKIVKITNLLVSIQLQGSCISAGYLKMGKHPLLCKRPLHYFDSIILNENYPMQSPTTFR